MIRLGCASCIQDSITMHIVLRCHKAHLLSLIVLAISFRAYLLRLIFVSQVDARFLMKCYLTMLVFSPVSAAKHGDQLLLRSFRLRVGRRHVPLASSATIGEHFNKII
jgi:hypothetical protein